MSEVDPPKVNDLETNIDPELDLDLKIEEDTDKVKDGVETEAKLANERQGTVKGKVGGSMNVNDNGKGDDVDDGGNDDEDDNEQEDDTNVSVNGADKKGDNDETEAKKSSEMKDDDPHNKKKENKENANANANGNGNGKEKKKRKKKKKKGGNNNDDANKNSKEGEASSSKDNNTNDESKKKVGNDNGNDNAGGDQGVVEANKRTDESSDNKIDDKDSNVETKADEDEESGKEKETDEKQEGRDSKGNDDLEEVKTNENEKANEDKPRDQEMASTESKVETTNDTDITKKRNEEDAIHDGEVSTDKTDTNDDKEADKSDENVTSNNDSSSNTQVGTDNSSPVDPTHKTDTDKTNPSDITNAINEALVKETHQSMCEGMQEVSDKAEGLVDENSETLDKGTDKLDKHVEQLDNAADGSDMTTAKSDSTVDKLDNKDVLDTSNKDNGVPDDGTAATIAHMTQEQLQQQLQEQHDAMTRLQAHAHSQQVQANLLTTTLRSKVRRRDQELKLIKGQHEQQISAVLSHLLYLEGQMQKEHTEIYEALQDKDDIIRRQKAAIEDLAVKNERLLQALKESHGYATDNGIVKPDNHVMQQNGNISIQDHGNKVILRGNKGRSPDKSSGSGPKVRFIAMKDRLRRHKSSLELYRHEPLETLMETSFRYGSEENLVVQENSGKSRDFDRKERCRSLVDYPVGLRGVDEAHTDSPDSCFGDDFHSPVISRNDSTSSLVIFGEKGGRSNGGLSSSYGFNELSKSRSVPHALPTVSENDSGSSSLKERPHSLPSVEMLTHVTTATTPSSKVNMSPSLSPTNSSPPSESNPFKSFKNVFKRKGSKKKKAAAAVASGKEQTDALKQHFKKFDLT